MNSVCSCAVVYTKGESDMNSGPHEPSGFPGSSAGKESASSTGDLGLIPGLGRSPGERSGYPLQYSGLENSMDCVVHEVTESDMTEWLSLSESDMNPGPEDS